MSLSLTDYYDTTSSYADKMTGLEFIKFLKESETPRIRLDGSNIDTGMWCTSIVTGIHRWKNEYKKRIIAKFQALNDWYDTYSYPVTMITFTCRQRGLTIPDQIDLLKESFNKAKKVMNKHLGTFPYVWVMEPHKSGYAHIHMLAFNYFSPEEKDRIRKLWVESYRAGSYGAAPKFVASKEHKHLDSAAAYAVKYVKKTMQYNLMSDTSSGYFKLSSWVWKMSRRDTPYKGVRFWSSSKEVSSVLAYQGKPDNGIRWWRVNYYLPESPKYPAGWFPKWVDEDMAAYPDRVCEFDRAFKDNFNRIPSCGNLIEFL
jgi:hypothetical protein